MGGGNSKQSIRQYKQHVKEQIKDGGVGCLLESKEESKQYIKENVNRRVQLPARMYSERMRCDDDQFITLDDFKRKLEADLRTKDPQGALEAYAKALQKVPLYSRDKAEAFLSEKGDEVRASQKAAREAEVSQKAQAVATATPNALASYSAYRDGVLAQMKDRGQECLSPNKVPKDLRGMVERKVVPGDVDKAHEFIKTKICQDSGVGVLNAPNQANARAIAVGVVNAVNKAVAVGPIPAGSGGNGMNRNSLNGLAPRIDKLDEFVKEGFKFQKRQIKDNTREIKAIYRDMAGIDARIQALEQAK